MDYLTKKFDFYTKTTQKRRFIDFRPKNEAN